MTEKVLGIGGVLLKARDPAGLAAWSIFPREATNCSGLTMVNYRVSDLDAMLSQVRALGGEVDEWVEVSDYRRFAWVTDPEGNRIELWQVS